MAAVGDGPKRPRLLPCWTDEVKQAIVAALKAAVRGKLSSGTRGPFALFPQRGKASARVCLENTVMLATLIEAHPWRIPPHSFLTKCILDVDSFFDNIVSGASSMQDAVHWAAGEAVHAINQYGYIRKLARNNLNSKNKSLAHLKNLCKSRFTAALGEAFPRLDSSSDDESSDGDLCSEPALYLSDSQASEGIGETRVSGSHIS